VNILEYQIWILYVSWKWIFTGLVNHEYIRIPDIDIVCLLEVDIYKINIGES
jgi:hypothetical protein